MTWMDKRILFWEQVYKYANHSKKKAKAKRELEYLIEFRKYVHETLKGILSPYHIDAVAKAILNK